MKPYPNFRDLERVAGITWNDLANLEPMLAELVWKARQAGVTCRCRSDVARVFAPIRNNLAERIGFAGSNHHHPVLGGSGAYQVAYWKLYDAVAGSLPHRAGRAEGAPAKQHENAVVEPSHQVPSQRGRGCLISPAFVALKAT
jgi:hypothetical protein